MQDLSKIQLLHKVSEQLGKVSKSKEAHLADERIIHSFIQELQKQEAEDCQDIAGGSAKKEED